MSEATETAAYAAQDMLDLTVGVVSAYVSNNSIPAAELSALIGAVHATLSGLASGGAPENAEPEVTKPTPAEIRKSIRPDGLISFIDGKTYQTLRRHLTGHGLTPETYKARYGLPADYPTTAPGYSAKRSELAKALGLGQPGARARAATNADADSAPKPRARGRKATEAQAA